MKITVWWRQSTGYFDACTHALVDAGHDVSVVYQAPTDQFPHKSSTDHLSHVSYWEGAPTSAQLTASLSADTDVLAVASWGTPEFVKGAEIAPSSILRLVASDSPWRASLKQRGGQLTHRRLLARAFDGAWVTGSPQRELVQRLGFKESQVIEHLYCCDTHLFSSDRPAKERFESPFLFVGRLVENKGLIPLVEAFARFRQTTGSTRRLRIVGSGPLNVDGDGIDRVPYANPTEVQAIMDDSFALIHPAHLEHWGLIVHESARMGLPLILTPTVHAGSRFLFPGINGYYSIADPLPLSGAMETLDQLDLATYERMSHASSQLGSLLSLESWVDNLVQGVAQLRRA